MTRALELLADVVRIPSVNPPAAEAPDAEEQVAERLRVPLAGAGLDTAILRSPGGRPSLLARLPGPTDRPPLVLVSHTDVVPVEPSAWRQDPFGAAVIDGELWGRGSLDMKGIAVMHVAAVVALATSGRTPAREVVVAAVADEEAGGAEGARWLLREHPDRVGFRDGAPPPEALGEGGFGLSGVVARDLLPIVVGEKAPLRLRARASGAAGHGSLPPTDQAIRHLAAFVGAATGPRTPRLHPVVRDLFATLAEAADGAQARLFRLVSGPAGPVAVRALAPLLRARGGAIGHLVADSITPTVLRAGYAANVVPGEAEVTLDARLLPDTDPSTVVRELAAVGRHHRVTVEELHRCPSPTSRRGALFDTLAAVSAGLAEAPLPVASLTPGTTDLRWWRRCGATAYGWAPVVLDPGQLAGFHGHDERIPVDGFERGVEAMAEAVTRAAG
jgi:acetylornithine deacetylase/succinyl-diaminopimelate desuccinylase-like protein